MKGEVQDFLQILRLHKRLIIPLYQRNYDWKEKNCQQLLNDLKTVHQHNKETHFFGSIVSQQESSGVSNIIDGQQRITTISLLLIALRNAAKSQQIEMSNDILIEQIYDDYLIYRFHATERKIKLKPIKKDMQAFDLLLEGKQEDYIAESNVTRNYNYLYNEIVKSNLSLDVWLDAVSKLVIINIELSKEDDPQLIFESLNSTGLDLSEADKIRNYLLMSFDDKNQEKYYNDYWNVIEENTDYSPTMFIRDFLTIKQRQICKIDNLYFEFKYYVEKMYSAREDVLEEMTEYSKYYKQINRAEFSNEKVRRKIIQLNSIGSLVAMPFNLQFLRYAKKNNLSNDEIWDVFDVIENYWARRIICNLPANALANVFSTLHNEVIKIIEREEIPISYYEVIKYLLLRKQGTTGFPKDDIVREQFKDRQIYFIQKKYKYFLLERLENENGNKTHDVIAEMESGKITIEHIMPQTLTPIWKQELGPDYERIHNTYLHTFANLTLTGYNINYSNHSFQEKKEGYIDKKGNKVYGFNDSAFRLNNFLKDCDKWDEEALIKRQELLIDKFFNLWGMIKTDYVPTKRSVEIESLDEETVFTGRTIVAYIYKNERYEVKTWKEMLFQVCKFAYNEKPSEMRALCYIDKRPFTSKKDDNNEFIAEQCYVTGNNSTYDKIKMLITLFNACNIPYSDLEFELLPIQEDDELNENNDK